MPVSFGAPPPETSSSKQVKSKKNSSSMARQGDEHSERQNASPSKPPRDEVKFTATTTTTTRAKLGPIENTLTPSEVVQSSPRSGLSPAVKKLRMRRSDTADSAMSLVSDDGDAGNKVDHPKEEGAHEGIHGIAAEDDDEDYEGDDISNDRMHSLHIEVRLKPESNVIHSRIKMLMSRYIHEYHTSFVVQEELPDEWKGIEMFEEHVERVWISECSYPGKVVPLSLCVPQIHIYQLSDLPIYHFSADGPARKSSSSSTDDENDDEPGGGGGDMEGGDVSSASVLDLPSTGIEGLWDSLIYETDIKANLLNYIHSTLIFGESGVDFNYVSWNRLVLLHGPPGTGKTSLCRSLAHKLAVRLSDRYHSAKLVEINSHSLFSKWFSESGKLVQRLFGHVMEMVEDESTFVTVIIDEVESLTSARAGAMSGKEPSDALRVVNALLTQLDRLKTKRNVLVMTTSNLSTAIDSAFIDRADIKQYIGLPPPQAIYWMLQSSLEELMKAGMVGRSTILKWQLADNNAKNGVDSKTASKKEVASMMLYELAHRCQGVSGRTLRRLPVIAHAHYINHHTRSDGRPHGTRKWLEAMNLALEANTFAMDKVEGRE